MSGDAEDADLKAKIAALSGRIDQHKQRATPQPYHIHKSYATQPDYHGAGRGHVGWSPYSTAPRGRGRGRGASAYRNRTLVINANSSPVTPEALPSATLPDVNGTWVSKTDRTSKQLINGAIYDKHTQERSRAIAHTKEHKARERDNTERSKLGLYFSRLAGHSSLEHGSVRPAVHNININGISFQVIDGGSKLVRVPNDFNRSTPTPKQTTIGGVKFLRSKNGNLYRAGLVKSAKQLPVKKIDGLCPKFTATGTLFPPFDRTIPLEGLDICGRGQCIKGPNCRYHHDPKKVAICKDYLSKGVCLMGDACDLSHDCTAQRVPLCLHFLRGNCTNDDCRYAHVRMNPSAPVCRAFASIGFCEKGSTCAERHVIECPDHANQGFCSRKNCRLPHVDRAGQIRKVAAAHQRSTDSDDSPDLSSDDEQYSSDGFDSDGVEELFISNHQTDGGHELSQQQDFVQFS